MADSLQTTPMKSPQTHETRRCGAKTRNGGTCQAYPVIGGNGRCRIHNGRAKMGPALPQYKDGKRSKLMLALPSTALSAAALEVVNNPSRIELTEHLAVLQAMLVDSIGRWNTGAGQLFVDLRKSWDTFLLESRRGAKADQSVLQGATQAINRMLGEGVADYLARKESADLIERIRRVSDTERKRLIDAEQMMSNDVVAALMGKFVTETLEVVTDPVLQGKLHAKYVAMLGEYRQNQRREG